MVITSTYYHINIIRKGSVIDMENHIYTTSNNSGIKPIDVAKAIGMSHEEFVKLPQGAQIKWAKLVYQYGYCKPTR